MVNVPGIGSSAAAKSFGEFIVVNQKHDLNYCTNLCLEFNENCLWQRMLGVIREEAGHALRRDPECGLADTQLGRAVPAPGSSRHPGLPLLLCSACGTCAPHPPLQLNFSALHPTPGASSVEAAVHPHPRSLAQSRTP